MSDLESSSFENLTDEEKQNVKALGLDKTMWDCYMNHYNGNSWEDLQATGAAQYYEILGWEQASWDEEEGATDPDTDDMYWDELSAVEQEAAFSVCFFKNSWDWVSLAEW